MEKNQEAKLAEEGKPTTAAQKATPAEHAKPATNGNQPAANAETAANALNPKSHQVILPDPGLIQSNYNLSELYTQLRKLVACKPDAI